VGENWRHAITGPGLIQMLPHCRADGKIFLRDSSWNVALLDFYGASAPTSESKIHFFHMQNFRYMLSYDDTVTKTGTPASVNVGNFY